MIKSDLVMGRGWLIRFITKPINFHVELKRSFCIIPLLDRKNSTSSYEMQKYEDDKDEDELRLQKQWEGSQNSMLFRQHFGEIIKSIWAIAKMMTRVALSSIFNVDAPRIWSGYETHLAASSKQQHKLIMKVRWKYHEINFSNSWGCSSETIFT